MKIKTIISNRIQIAFLWLALLISLPPIAEELEHSFEAGVDYQIITKSDSQDSVSQDLAQLSELEAISNVEIFYWYGCESCYQVEGAISDYLRLNPELTLKRTPLVIRPNWRPQAYIQPLMLQLSQMQNLPTSLDVYLQCLTDCDQLKDFDSIVDWFSGKMPEQTLPLINKDLIWQTEKNYQKRAEIFSISQVPTIIINETYKVDANQAQTAKRLVAIIDFLMAK